ncbi:MAG: hypothetical protein ACLFQR_05610 [Desulfovibrionales bacterium]
MKRVVALIFVGLLTLTSLTGIMGCETMGRWTGEGAEEVEEGSEDFGEGYEEGKD